MLLNMDTQSPEDTIESNKFTSVTNITDAQRTVRLWNTSARNTMERGKPGYDK